MPGPTDPRERRVLILAPTGRDAALAAAVLAEAQIATETCSDVADLRHAIEEKAGAVLLTEEVLTREAVNELGESFRAQPPWSDLPLLVFTGGDIRRESLPAAVRQLAELADVTLIDRPTRRVTLVSAVRAALRARWRQYELRDLLEQLEGNVRQRDQFLAMLSHELRNPLAAILATVQLMDRRDGSAQQARERGIVRRQTQLLSRLVDDLLDVSRITLGKIVLSVAPVDVGDLVARCVQSVAESARERGIQLGLVQGATDLIADADELRLEQIVNNLLTNALKYTPRGGEVSVSVAPIEEFVEIRVRDSGVGIEGEVLPRIFEPFTQADSTIERSNGGLGIGLTLVRNLVALHGGTVTASSPGRGAGSAFFVRLPRRAAPATAAAADVAPADSSARRILIVEDNADVREGLKCLLEDAGHCVLAAADGEEGIDVALRKRPDVLLVDIGLPKLDGYAVARRVRASLADEVLLVAVTGYGSPEDRRRALEAGFDDHLTKPVTLDAVLRLLDRAADRSREVDTSRRAG